MVFLAEWISYAQADWLTATVEADSQDPFIQAKLAEIKPGVTNAFNFARDQIGFEAYTGSLRGARGALWSEAGNSLDKVSLLIALLRGQGIGARYVRGTLAPSDIRTLIGSLFDPVALANAVGNIPNRYPKSDPENDPGLVARVSDHWWVELEGGTQLDPSFADGVIGTVRGTKTATSCCPARRRPVQPKAARACRASWTRSAEPNRPWSGNSRCPAQRCYTASRCMTIGRWSLAIRAAWPWSTVQALLSP